MTIFYISPALEPMKAFTLFTSWHEKYFQFVTVSATATKVAVIAQNISQEFFVTDLVNVFFAVIAKS